MTFDDDKYWDDDPSDPMPDHTFNEPVPIFINMFTGELDEEASAGAMHIILERWFLIRRTWWRRRIQRERELPVPHPDTETIAANTEIDMLALDDPDGTMHRPSVSTSKGPSA